MGWKASWIWHPETGNANNFYLFARKAFGVESLPSSGTLFITANNIYKAFVNGVYVGTGPNPSDPSRYYYDVYDVASLLRPGANAVSVIAHSYGPDRNDVNRQNWGRAGLLVELRESREGETLLGTDETWKVLQAPCWDQNAQICGIHYGDYQEHFDSREEIDGWMEPAFDDSAWKTPQVIGRPPVEPWTRLVEREIPFLTYAPWFTFSALTRQRLGRNLETIWEVHTQRQRRIGTSELNAFLERTVARQPPRPHQNGLGKIYFGTQIETAPPTVLLSVNEPRFFARNYLRYLNNQFRQEFGFAGTRVFIKLKKH